MLNALQQRLCSPRSLPPTSASFASLCRMHTIDSPVPDVLSLLSSSSPPSDPSIWNAALRRLVDDGDHAAVLALYRRMSSPSSRAVPDNFTFPLVLKSCAYLGDLAEGTRIHRNAADLGLVANLFVSNSLISMYGRCGDTSSAKKLFDQMPERNVVTWSAMIGAYADNERDEEALSLFRCMIERVRPNRPTFLRVMPCIRRSEDADDLYKLITRLGLDSDTVVLNAMMVMYSRCGRVGFSRRLFDGIINKDLVSWSSMIEAYAQADMFIKALNLWKDMKLLGVVPDHVNVLGLIRACSNSTTASVRHAQLIHAFVVRGFHQHNVMVMTALVDLYVKRGRLKSARRVFDGMQQKSVVTWSAMISGHAGLIDEGWRCFNSMSSEFGITPRAEHYACMVDLLGRAGKLKEAREFIEIMPMEPNSSVWGSLLGACRIHPDLEIAELAARSLFELDSKNSGRYILLSNIYISLGKIEEANNIRTLMRRRGVKKTVGYTVIELKGKVFKFLVGDQSNPDSDLIYKELDRLMKRIKEMGYIPNTSFALHDVEEETKEQSLYVHSEKLAIVFGILKLDPECDIWIQKNLRVCGDCHEATKFISKVAGRKIIVRDSHRFHHFSGGSCSCGDYW
ncbi:putative pentatricopeptide repeat-containing protein At3g49142 [Phalaenopsis equestris]|uniref:putative pentatricopeptide repeat-containing protein At3g49142 n=1 Tax=Phalaenopsis equestris TaxID=78828 RepID=UPI0009E3E360|nr:putative pentatricopeptide repeat-containing protein At3g49142 [Phalaenopsis equestris]